MNGSMRSQILVAIPMVEGPMRRVALGAATVLRQAWPGSVNLLTRSIDWASFPLKTVAGAVAFLQPTNLPAIALGFPLVNAGYHYLSVPFPSVACDPVAIGRMAASHLAALPVARRVVLSDAIPEIDARGQACLRHLSALGLVGERWEPSQISDPAALAQRCGPTGRIALYAGSDRRAESVLHRAHTAGIPVPERLAILATDDNEVVQCSSPIPLSTISVPATGIGRTAAKILLDLISGGVPPSDPILLAPGRLVVRSSSILPTSDLAVEQAKQYLAASLHRQIGLDEVARHCGLARRTLENRFRRHQGCTMGEEFARLRLGKACELLERTGRSIDDIAKEAGFSTPSGLSRLFSTRLGISPTAYRAGFGDPDKNVE